MFEGTIELPDCGVLTQQYDKLDDLKVWLLSCLRMDGDPSTLRVTLVTPTTSIDLTNRVGQDLTQQLTSSDARIYIDKDRSSR